MTNTNNERERELALQEGHRIAASEEYFNARPQIDSADRRRVFEAGFDKGYTDLRAEYETKLAAAQARIAELEETLALFTSHSMSEVRPAKGESFIGWQKYDGISAHERVSMARAILANKSPTEALDRIKLATIGSIKPHWDEKNQMFIAHYEDIAKMADEIKMRLRHE